MVQRNTAKHKNLLIIASIVIVAIVVLIATWFLLGPKNKEVSCANGEFLNYANICCIFFATISSPYILSPTSMYCILQIQIRFSSHYTPFNSLLYL